MRVASRRRVKFAPTLDRLESLSPVSTLVPGRSGMNLATVGGGTGVESRAVASQARGQVRLS